MIFYMYSAKGLSGVSVMDCFSNKMIENSVEEIQMRNTLQLKGFKYRYKRIIKET